MEDGILELSAKQQPPTSVGFPYPNALMRHLLRLPIWMYRIGLGSLLNLAHIMILTTRGRKSGLPRHTAIEFRVHGSKIYVVSAWGERPHWYQNLMLDPGVTLRLGTRQIGAQAHVVDDAGEALRVLHLFRKKAPAVYDAILTRLSTEESVSLKNLPDVSHQFTIVRFDAMPGEARLPAVKADLRWIWPLALVFFVAAGVVVRRGRA